MSKRKPTTASDPNKRVKSSSSSSSSSSSTLPVQGSSSSSSSSSSTLPVQGSSSSSAVSNSNNKSAVDKLKELREKANTLEKKYESIDEADKGAKQAALQEWFQVKARIKQEHTKLKKIEPTTFAECWEWWLSDATNDRLKQVAETHSVSFHVKWFASYSRKVMQKNWYDREEECKENHDPFIQIIQEQWREQKATKTKQAKSRAVDASHTRNRQKEFQQLFEAVMAWLKTNPDLLVTFIPVTAYHRTCGSGSSDTPYWTPDDDQSLKNGSLTLPVSIKSMAQSGTIEPDGDLSFEVEWNEYGRPQLASGQDTFRWISYPESNSYFIAGIPEDKEVANMFTLINGQTFTLIHHAHKQQLGRRRQDRKGKWEPIGFHWSGALHTNAMQDHYGTKVAFVEIDILRQFFTPLLRQWMTVLPRVLCDLVTSYMSFREYTD